MRQGAWEEGIAACREAIRLRPDFPEAFCNLGLALLQQGRPEEAAAACRRAIELRPAYPEAYCNLSAVLIEQGNLDAAVGACRQALALRPAYPQALINLALALTRLDRIEEAVAAYRQAIEGRPDDREAWASLAALLVRLGRGEEAIDACVQAINLAPTEPGVYRMLGNALRLEARLDEALLAYRKAVEHGPADAESYHHLGVGLLFRQRLDDATEAWRRAVELRPDHAEAQWNLGLALLLQGQLAEGWAKYEWRWSAWPSTRRGLSQPQWQGEDLTGRTILLHAEQGLGDTIQFARYAPLLAERGARVLLEVQAPLARLLGDLPGVAQLIPRGDPLPDFDLHCPLMSLPGAFGTRLDTIPAPIPYLRAEPERIALWRDRLPQDGFRIGIAWQGGPASTEDETRSIPLSAFAPLAQVPGARLVSLQKNHGLDQLDRLPPGMAVETLGPDLDAGPDGFLDTAAVMMSLDLVVTADTSLAHLAGALGRPAWVALRAIPDWRWMMDREDSPWYPTLRLFRQKAPGDWDDVFGRIAAELDRIVTPGDRAAVRPTP